MAAIVRKLSLLLLILASAAWADSSAEIRGVLGDMANALSDGDPALAVTSLSQSCVDYQKLNDDFHGLADAYAIHNNIAIGEEDITATSASLSVQWNMNLTPVQGTLSTNRSAELTIKLALEGKHWRITEISPNQIFDP